MHYNTRYRAAFNSILLHLTIVTDYFLLTTRYPIRQSRCIFERVLHDSKAPLCTAAAQQCPPCLPCLEGGYPGVSLTVRGRQLPSADDRLYPQKKMNIHPLYFPFFKHELRILRIEEVPNNKVNIWLASSLVECPADTCLSRDALSEQRTLVKLLNSIHIIFLFFYFLSKIPRQQNTTTDI
jgi:hypothetical protein